VTGPICPPPCPPPCVTGMPCPLETAMFACPVGPVTVAPSYRRVQA
jgi:hypothetical protein